MRTTPVLLAVLLTSSIAAADETGKDLGPTVVRAHLKGVDAKLAQCYVAAVGDGTAGRLDVTLTIHRKGIVDAVDVRAPGASPKAVKKIDACVRALVANVTFPTREVGTTAVLPYVWHKATAPGAGPQESCWNAKGCKTTDDARHHAVQPAKRAKSITTNRQARRAPRAS